MKPHYAFATVDGDTVAMNCDEAGCRRYRVDKVGVDLAVWQFGKGQASGHSGAGRGHVGGRRGHVGGT